MSESSGDPGPLVSPQDNAPAAQDSTREEPLVRVEHLSKAFPVQSTSLFRRSHEFVHAVDDVSLDVHPGETRAP